VAGQAKKPKRRARRSSPQHHTRADAGVRHREARRRPALPRQWVWLGAIGDLGGSLKTSSGTVDRARGGAEIHREPGRVSIVFWNRTPGIETMDAKKHFVAKAIAVRAADMWVYILRKMREQGRNLKTAASL
jgi:hypothetical protein